MYTKDEIKELKREFWEGYGNFCRNLPAMEYRKDNFLLNTKMKGVEFKYDAGRDGAYVILEINLRDENARFEKFEQFERYKAILEADFPMAWCGILPIGANAEAKSAESTRTNPVSTSTAEATGWNFSASCHPKCKNWKRRFWK